MPELPEVETVRRALAPVMEGSTITHVEQRRANLRFDFPDRFVERLTTMRVERLGRRGKYLTAWLSSGEVLIMHLGMSGRFSLLDGSAVRASSESRNASPGVFTFNTATLPTHDHVVFHLAPKQPVKIKAKAKQGLGVPARVRVIYNDPRRFGFMDLVDGEAIDQCRHFSGMGPEPLGNGFNESVLAEALRARSAPVKQALLDQRVVAGLGNIYVCEALFRSGVSPRRRARNVPAKTIAPLVREIVMVLDEAIEAGGSSLRDFASSDGTPGYFQHRFQVYGREGEPCLGCGAPIQRIVQSGRSTFFCSMCQR